MDLLGATSLVRLMMFQGIPLEVAINNPVIPSELISQIRKQIAHEQMLVLEDPGVLSKSKQISWINDDETDWYYWRSLRDYLISYKNWTLSSIQSLDTITDVILGHIRSPKDEKFIVKGLVVGFVQSGKTANYTSVIAKSADAGYRLIIVLAGIDNGLRQQTQIRLDHELVGYTQFTRESVPLPPLGKQWQLFTTEDFHGDFQPGYVNHGALQGDHPILLVIKKNGTVLKKLINWLKLAPDEVVKSIPVLIIDDEADQASIDTRGDGDLIEPTTINRRIRQLLSIFEKRAYIAYTATPYANVLVKHDRHDPKYGKDLYPEDFIVVLPKPENYFGAEDFFGYYDEDVQERFETYDVIRDASDADIEEIDKGIMPETLKLAICDFLIASSFRIIREGKDVPSTMLLHGSQIIDQQRKIARFVEKFYENLSSEWRYAKEDRLEKWFLDRYEREFIPCLSQKYPIPPFSSIYSVLDQVIESLQVKVINSASGELLDYYQEPTIKAIAVGGNRLSRGLTLEGLITSYFFRPAKQYDTLMQMGRWFGFRDRYADLIRIYMPAYISGWFKDLAFTEAELRMDLKQYELQDLSPIEFGTRIRQHPILQVTSAAKRRDAESITLEQSYAGTAAYTLNFPFSNTELIDYVLGWNIELTKNLLGNLDQPLWDGNQPIWSSVRVEKILTFISEFKTMEDDRLFSVPLIQKYIEKQVSVDELTKWDVCILGLKVTNPTLGEMDLGLMKRIPMIARSRLSIAPNSIGALTSPGDEALCLTPEELEAYKKVIDVNIKSRKQNSIARAFRSANRGLLLIYPISKYSSLDLKPRKNRRPLFDDPNDIHSHDIIAITLSFPHSNNCIAIEARYLVGSVGWKAN